MIPMLQVALMVHVARSLPAGRGDRVALVARPRGVVHIAVAPLTPSGRFLRSSGRTVCRTHTRRLSVVPRCHELPGISGRRVCVRCQRALARVTGLPGLDGRPMDRDQEATAFALLTVRQLGTIVTTCSTADETYQVDRLASILFGPATVKPPARRTPAEQERADLEQLIHQMRRRLTSAALTREERDAVVRARELETAEHARIQAGRRKTDARDRAIDRQRHGQYLMPHERQLLNSA